MREMSRLDTGPPDIRRRSFYSLFYYHRTANPYWDVRQSSQPLGASDPPFLLRLDVGRSIQES